MKAQDFAALEQALSHNASGIVGRILAQSRKEGPLMSWEERFLEERSGKLDFPALASWLAHKPRNPALVVDAIAALKPNQESLAGWHLVQHAEAIGCENWAILVERLQPMLRLPRFEDLSPPQDASAENAEIDPSAPRADVGALGWLMNHGVPRSELVALALDGIVASDITEAALAEIIRWLGERLVTRSAWESHGEAVLYRFYSRWGWDLIGPLCQLLHHAIERSRALAGSAEKPTGLARGLYAIGTAPTWMTALHESLARVLIRVTREALQHGEIERAQATLAALLHLSPPARIVPHAHCLLALPDLTIEVRSLITLTTQLSRRESGRTATLEGVMNALRELPMS